MNQFDANTKLDLTINRIKQAIELLTVYTLEEINDKTANIVLYSVENITRHINELESILDSPFFKCEMRSEKTYSRSDEDVTQTATEN